jgi:hypothetical protein
MRKYALAIMLPMLLVSYSLLAQMTTPRVLTVRLLDQYGNSLPEDKRVMKFQASLRGVVKTESSFGFGFSFANGDMWGYVQLGNFGFQWVPGDTLDIVFSRLGDQYLQARTFIVIPEGSGAIFWGRPDNQERQYPGEPVRLYPFILHIVAQDPGIPVLINGKATALVTGTPVTAKTKDDITGIFSLAPPPTGWRWEPARYFITLRDFEFSDSAYADADGVAQPGWARTLEFRLVPEE